MLPERGFAPQRLLFGEARDRQLPEAHYPQEFDCLNHRWLLWLVGGSLPRRLRYRFVWKYRLAYLYHLPN